MNVMALLPYLVMNYEDANELCISSSKNIAHVSTEKSKKLENLSTVMTLYSRRTFRCRGRAQRGDAGAPPPGAPSPPPPYRPLLNVAVFRA